MFLFTLFHNFLMKSGATQLSAKLVAAHQRKLLSLGRQSYQSENASRRDLNFTNRSSFLAPHNNYLPQTNKVIFSEGCVCYSVHGEGDICMM